MYHFGEYAGFIILILTTIWFLDVLLAKHKYRNCKRNDLIRLLKSPQGKITLKKITSGGEVEYVEYLNPSEVKHISILQVDRKGGAFQEKVATVWQSSVSFNDESELLLSEDEGMPSVNIEFSFLGILSVFEPDWDAVDIGEYAFAMGLIIRKTLLLVQPQYVSIDRALTRYYIHDKLAGECKTGEIDNISLLTNPEPTIIVLNSNSSLEVRNLKSMKEFNSFFHQIREGIKKFIVTPNKTGMNPGTTVAAMNRTSRSTL